MDTEALILAHLDLAERLAFAARRRVPCQVETGDLIGWAYVGLVQAARSFDPSQGVLFLTHANGRIRGAILDGLRSQDHMKRGDRLRIKRGEQEAAVVLPLHCCREDQEPAVAEPDRRDGERASLLLDIAARVLSPQEARTFALLREGKSQKDAASVLGCSESRVSQRLREMIPRMKERLLREVI